MLLKLKFMQTSATLDIASNGPDTIILKPEAIVGILDLRSLSYYKSNMVYYNRILVNTIGLKRQTPFVNILINL